MTKNQKLPYFIIICLGLLGFFIYDTTATGDDMVNNLNISHTTLANVTNPYITQQLKDTTVATTIDPNSFEAQKQRALEFISKNVKSETCNSTVSAVAMTLSSLEDACGLIKTQADALRDQNCSEADILVIKTAVCIDATTLSPEQEILVKKQIALDYINKNVKTEECKILASMAANTVSTLEEACALTKTQADILKSNNCSEADILVIKTAVCVNDSAVVTSTTSAPDKDADAHREKVLCVIDTQLSSKTCKATARSQAEGKSDRVAACNTLKNFAAILDKFECTQADYNKLYEVICDNKDVQCTPIGPVDEVVENLTPRCRSTISIDLNNLRSPQGCSSLNSAKDQLLDNLICTPGDIQMLHQIVCKVNNATAESSIASGARMNEAVVTVQTKLSGRCRDVIANELKGKISLEDLCLKVKSAGPTLVTRGTCTHDDYDLLEPAVCLVPRVYEPKEQQQRDEIHKVIIKLSPDCKKTMLDQEAQMQDSTVENACTKLTASHDLLLETKQCTEEEIKNLNAVICNSAPGGISTAAILIVLTSLVNLWHWGFGTSDN